MLAVLLLSATSRPEVTLFVTGSTMYYLIRLHDGSQLKKMKYFAASCIFLQNIMENAYKINIFKFDI